MAALTLDATIAAIALAVAILQLLVAAMTICQNNTLIHLLASKEAVKLSCIFLRRTTTNNRIDAHPHGHLAARRLDVFAL